MQAGFRCKRKVNRQIVNKLCVGYVFERGKLNTLFNFKKERKPLALLYSSRVLRSIVMMSASMCCGRVCIVVT